MSFSYGLTNEGLLGYWKMDYNSSIIDSLGLVNSSFTNGSLVNGKFHGAVYYNNSLAVYPLFAGTKFSNFPYDSRFMMNEGEQMTLTAWINTSQTTSGDILGLTRDIVSSNNKNYEFVIFNDYFGFAYYPNTGSDNMYLIENTISSNYVNLWTHLAVTYDFAHGDSLLFYVNGKKVNGSWYYGNGNVSMESDFGTGNMNYSLFMGYPSAVYTGKTFSGSIDDVTLWNRELSLSEIQQLNASTYNFSTSSPVIIPENFSNYNKSFTIYIPAIPNIQDSGGNAVATPKIVRPTLTDYYNDIDFRGAWLGLLNPAYGITYFITETLLLTKTEYLPNPILTYQYTNIGLGSYYATSCDMNPIENISKLPSTTGWFSNCALYLPEIVPDESFGSLWYINTTTAGLCDLTNNLSGGITKSAVFKVYIQQDDMDNINLLNTSIQIALKDSQNRYLSRNVIGYNATRDLYCLEDYNLDDKYCTWTGDLYYEVYVNWNDRTYSYRLTDINHNVLYTSLKESFINAGVNSISKIEIQPTLDGLYLIGDYQLYTIDTPTFTEVTTTDFYSACNYSSDDVYVTRFYNTQENGALNNFQTIGLNSSYNDAYNPYNPAVTNSGTTGGYLNADDTNVKTFFDNLLGFDTTTSSASKMLTVTLIIIVVFFITLLVVYSVTGEGMIATLLGTVLSLILFMLFMVVGYIPIWVIIIMIIICAGLGMVFIKKMFSGE
jgi:hypothetical protein